MTLALNLHITEARNLRVVIYDIDDEFGAASVRDIFEVNDTSQKNKTTLRMMIKTRATECMHVMVEEGVKGAIRVGNHYCIPVRSRGNLWKKAWEHVSNEAELMQQAAPKPAPEEEPKSVYTISDSSYITLAVFEFVEGAKKYWKKHADRQFRRVEFNYVESLSMWEVQYADTAHKIGYITKFALRNDT